MDVLILALAVFAVYRLATDLAWGSGPLGWYASLRGRVLSTFGPDDWRSEGVTCPICWSFWLALIAALLIAPIDQALLYWFGIAGAAAFAVRLTNHD